MTRKFRRHIWAMKNSDPPLRSWLLSLQSSLVQPVISLDNAAVGRRQQCGVNCSRSYFLRCEPRALTGVGTSGRARDRCGPRSPSSSNCRRFAWCSAVAAASRSSWCLARGFHVCCFPAPVCGVFVCLSTRTLLASRAGTDFIFFPLPTAHPWWMWIPPALQQSVGLLFPTIFDYWFLSVV